MATVAEFKIRYPAITASDETIEYWMVDAQRFTGGFRDIDLGPAVMALAAHNITKISLGTPAGTTIVKSGTVSVSYSDDAANGGYSSTVYGQEFMKLQRRNIGGPRVMDTGFIPELQYNNVW